MAKKKSNKKAKISKKEIKKEKAIPKPKYDGSTRSFRFRNPEDHADKYEWITLKKGDTIPPKVQPILDKEAEKKKLAERVEDLAKDLADDGKRNFSKDEKKKSPGRKKKKK